MSRIGRKPVPVPANVKVSLADSTINVEGPKGKLSYAFRKEMGVSYAAIDRYMDGGAVTDAERAIIERFHRNSEHKRVGRKDYRAN